MERVNIFKRPAFISAFIIALLMVAWVFFVGKQIQRNIQEDAEEDAWSVLNYTLQQAENMFNKNEQQCIALAQYTSFAKKDSAILEQTLASLLRNNPNLTAAFCFFYNTPDDTTSGGGLYLKVTNHNIEKVPVGDYIPKIEQHAIYKRIQSNPQTYWETPQVSVKGEVNMTYIVPIVNEQNQGRGFIGINMDLSKLDGILTSSSIRYHDDKDAFMFIMDSDGMVTNRFGTKISLHENIIGQALEDNNTGLASILHQMRNGDKGYVSFSSPERGIHKSIMLFMPLKEQRLSVALSFSEYHLTNALLPFLWISVGIVLFIFALMALWLWFFYSRKSDAVQKLKKSLTSISTGELNTSVPMISFDEEMSDLAYQISVMQRGLDTHIKQNVYINRKHERVEHEKNIARNIRNYFYENGLLFLTDIPAKRLKIAKQYQYLHHDIGGDFHDYFNISPEHACIVAGTVTRSKDLTNTAMDVVMTMNLIRAYVSVGKPLNECVNDLNKALIRQNKNRFKVQLTLCIINCSNGALEWVNTGNPPPLLVSSESILPLNKKHGLPLATHIDETYTYTQKTLNTEEILLIYTSGIIDRVDLFGKPFGTEGLEELIAKTPTQNPSFLIEKINETLTSFAGTQGQQDDYTIYAIKLMPDEKQGGK